MLYIRFDRKWQSPTAQTMQKLFGFTQNSLVLSARTPALTFYISTICFPLLRPFHLVWMDRICSFLKQNDAKVPRAGSSNGYSRSLLAQRYWPKPCWAPESLTEDGKVSVLSSHPGWCIQCRVVGCRWIRFLGRMSSMQSLTLGRRFSVQILPASSNYKYRGIIIGKHDEILWLAFCSPVLDIMLGDIII